MIERLSAAMQARLRARGVHVYCHYGTERLDREMPLPGAIELEWNDGPDTFGPSVGSKGIPSAVGQMQALGVASVEVRVASTKAGATHADHRALARLVVDMLVLEARDWLNGRGYSMPGARGGFVDPPDTTQPHGATYELDIDFARGVGLPTQAEIDGVLVDGTSLVGAGVVRVNVGTSVGVVCEPEPPAPGDEEENGDG